MHFTKQVVHYVNKDLRNFTTEIHVVSIGSSYSLNEVTHNSDLSDSITGRNSTVQIHTVVMNFNPECNHIACLCRDFHSKNEWQWYLEEYHQEYHHKAKLRELW